MLHLVPLTHQLPQIAFSVGSHETWPDGPRGLRTVETRVPASRRDASKDYFAAICLGPPRPTEHFLAHAV